MHKSRRGALQSEERAVVKPYSWNRFVMHEEQREGPCNQIILQVAQGRLGPEPVNADSLW